MYQVESDLNGFSHLTPPPPPPLMAAASTTNSPNNVASGDDAAAGVMELEFQEHLGFESNTQLMQEVIHDSNQMLSFDQSNWGTDCVNEIQEMGYNNDNNNNPTSDLLNLFRLPRCSNSGSVFYDPLFHLNFPPPPQQPPIFRELFQSVPHFPTTRNGSLGDEGDGGDRRQLENGILEFSREIACMGKEREGTGAAAGGTTERQRRQHLNDKYNDLKKLVPNPTKPDRASVVGDAIEYIKELKRTVNELKTLMEKKRSSRERNNKRLKLEESDNVNGGEADGSTLIRSSWLQRKSKDAEVDVRIIEDEVTIKLVQRKKTNCLLIVSKLLDELRLDLHHLSGGHIGDHYSYLFNTKMYDGCSVYAITIANKIIELVDRQTVCNTTYL